MPLALGTRLGTYEITSPLGIGGMGEVYRARDTRLGRDVAVKVLPEAVASSPDRLARFEREARTVAGLNHPNIVTLYSIEEEDGVRFLTMELVEGQSLDRHVTPGGLPLARVLELSIPLAEALAAAHARGVVHRDLKPGNVMVTRENRVKVLDFGLATSVREEPTAGDEAITATAAAPLSAAGRVMGTTAYMAPEQARGAAVDARADLFAFGIILYELATGRRPFKGATAADVISAVLRDEPEPVQSVRGDLPVDLDRIVGRCMEKDPRARFQSAQEVCDALRRLEQAPDRGAASRRTPHAVASIAVLPFVNRSRDEKDEYFSDGLADELLNMLAKIQRMRVAARTSSFSFKDKRATVAEVGRALNVATVLEGSVRKAGNRVRISVQLVKVSDGYHLWSEVYDRTLEDIFAVQDDIAQSVVKELRATLLGDDPDSPAGRDVSAEVARAARGRATNPEAHRIYLQARHHFNRFTRDDTATGIAYLKEALELESDFALAWVWLGLAYVREAEAGWVPVASGFKLGGEAIARALSLEPELAEAHAIKARIQLVFDWDLRGAEASMRRALASAPGNDSVLRAAAELARHTGRFQEAVELNRRALEQDPLAGTTHGNVGLTLSGWGRHVEAEAAYRKALELTPNRIGTHAALALSLLAQGKGEEALSEAGREPDEGYRLWMLALVNTGLGREVDSAAALRELTERYADDSAFQIAEVHAARREQDKAFEWLDRAYRQRDGGLLTELKSSRYFPSLERDPRWSPFLKKLGYEG